MKRILFIFILITAIFILCSCESNFVEYPYDQKFDDGTGLEPVIKGFTGELFGDRNITVDGLFSGSEKLDIVSNMIYCNDDGSIIWWDGENGSLYRLNNKNEKSKICSDEDCRNNIDGPCTHFAMFDCLYANGWLYYTYGGYDSVDVEVNTFYNKYETRQKIISEGAFIYRYNIDAHELEKLIEFQGVKQCELALNGRYLYAQTYTWAYSAVTEDYYKADFGITRIDLYQENAVVVYSDIMNRDDFDKICDPAGFMFTGDKIIMPVNGMINICNAEMQNIKTLIEFEKEYIRDLYFYGDDLYFITNKGLCRVSMEIYSKYNFADGQDDKTVLLNANKREILNKDIKDFCIDGDFLYYTLNGNTKLYRIKLDYSRELEFNSAVAIYPTWVQFNRWKVFDGYLYSTMQIVNSAWRCRIKLLSDQEPYYFYKEF